jgi:hypothetical protein
VIHFNFGLHDVQRSTLEQYEANLTRIVQHLQETEAELVFATSTPVLPGTTEFVEGDVVPYNDVAQRVMKRAGVAIDDLYKLARMHPEYQIPGDLHFTDRGYSALGNRVARSIYGALIGPDLTHGDHSPADERIRYVGLWSREETGGHEYGTRKITTDSRATAFFSFVGDGVVIYRGHGPQGGTMELCVDQQCHTVDNYFPRDFGTQPYGVQGLERGIHAVRISNPRGDFLDLGGVRIYDERPPLPPGRYAEDHLAIRYHGSWIRQQRSEHPRPWTGWVFTSVDPEASARIAFRGTGLVLYRGIYDDRLETSLCIVRGKCVRESGFSDALFWGQPVLLVGLPNGEHEAELRMLSGRAFDIEAIDVLGEIPALPVGTHEASHEGIRYFGHWNGTELTVAKGAKHAMWQSRSPRAAVYFSFEGDSVALQVAESSDRGSIELCVDDQCRVFRTNCPRTKAELTWKRVSGLGRRVHHAVLRKVDGRYLDLAGVEVGSAR